MRHFFRPVPGSALLMLILILLVPGCGCRDLDQEAWDRARKVDTEAGYRLYREQFPKGSFFSESGRRAVSRAFERARQKSTIDDWNHFFEKAATLPVDESTANTARYQVTLLHFNQARDAGTVAALLEFQKQFPMEFGRETDELIARIRWKTAKEAGTIAGWREYLGFYPRGEQALAAVQEIETIELAGARKTGTAAAYHQFRRANANGQRIDAALEELRKRRDEEFDRALSSGKMTAGFDYLDRWGASHPKGREMIRCLEKSVGGVLSSPGKTPYSLQSDWKAEAEGMTFPAEDWLPELTAGTMAVQLAGLSGLPLDPGSSRTIRITGRLEAVPHIYNIPDEATARRYSGARVSGMISWDHPVFRGLARRFSAERTPPATLDDTGLPLSEAQARRRDRERLRPADAPFQELLYQGQGLYPEWLQLLAEECGWDMLPGLLHHADAEIGKLALRMLEKKTGQHPGTSRAAWAAWFARQSSLLREPLASQQSLLPSVRLAAIHSVRRLNALATLPVLADFLNDDADEVRQAAHEALVRLTGNDMGTDAKAWLDFYHKSADRWFPPPAASRWHWSHDTLSKDDR